MLKIVLIFYVSQNTLVKGDTCYVLAGISKLLLLVCVQAARISS